MFYDIYVFLCFMTFMCFYFFIFYHILYSHQSKKHQNSSFLVQNEAQKNTTCPILRESVVSVATNCGHFLCGHCYTRIVRGPEKSYHPRCPICRWFYMFCDPFWSLWCVLWCVLLHLWFFFVLFLLYDVFVIHFWCFMIHLWCVFNFYDAFCDPFRYLWCFQGTNYVHRFTS